MENKKIKIIFDTDIGGDCDDTGALAMVHRLAEKGLCELLCVTVSTSNPYSAGCADAINRWYNRVVPIGQTDKVIPGDDEKFFEVCYGKHICENFENDYYGTGKKPENAVKLLRKTLAKSSEKVNFIVIGSLVNVAGLLLSKPDEISSLSGEELIKQKVECFSVMGGHFPKDGDEEVWFGTEQMLAECNIKVDISSAKIFFEKCPVNCVVSQFFIGWKMLTGNVLIERERKNPVAESYFVHSHGNRSSWDLTSAYYAILGTGDIFTLGFAGDIAVDDKGVTTFTERKNGKFRLLECPSINAAAKRIDEIITGRI
ncbi:MAG: nucleoside hydrolase [Candidatus Borkfalkiaceae bacterium]|nr:nucleoside hydrolase [Christensenellaceae bacterium]